MPYRRRPATPVADLPVESAMRLGMVVALSLCAGVAAADEGMWMPSQLPEIAAQLEAAGFEGRPEELADLTRAPMNAVVSLGGCTASFVSPDGLVLTNHHCAYGAIQLNSTAQRNLMADGFNAGSRERELSAGPAARVFVTVAFDRITDRVLAGARGKTGRAYFDAIDAAGKAEVAACERHAGHRCRVADMYYGSQFYLIKQLELRDIRLVYAPPEAIGKYGDDIDNFVWPRHTGDFAFYRAYVSPDGTPAAYAAENVPYAPPAHLAVSTEPVRAGDFAMVAGYPGVTFRHRTAVEFAHQFGWQLPSRVEHTQGLISAIESGIGSDEERRVLYASTLASLKNSLKRAQGELDGLRRSDAVRVRRDDETAMLAWLARQPGGRAARADIDAVAAHLESARTTRERDQWLASARPSLMASALSLQRLALERVKPDAQRQTGYQLRDEPQIEATLKQVQRRYHPDVEKAQWRYLLARYRALPADQRIAEVEAVFGTDAAQAERALDAIYDRTAFGTESERLRLFAGAPGAVANSEDALMTAAARLLPAVLRQEQAEKARDGELLRLRPAYMAALVGYRRSQGRAVYPDANSTLRVSFGRVSALEPRDAVSYAPLTTVQGIVEKHTGVVPFDAPEPLLAAIRAGDFGSTADEALGTQTVDFLTNLDTTGGNSGSPVLDARGRLIGLNFDSNWEAVSASWMFDPRYKRAIHVDMRYLRWLLAKVYPAPELLLEMALPVE
jgi:hypothetical protein